MHVILIKPVLNLFTRRSGCAEVIAKRFYKRSQVPGDQSKKLLLYYTKQKKNGRFSKKKKKKKIDSNTLI